MSALAITLNMWSRGEYAGFWIWLGTAGATPWLGVIALLVIGSRVIGTARIAGAANAAGREEGAARVWKLALASVLGSLLAVAVSDAFCSQILKPGFKEARPCTIAVTKVPAPLECGSGYGMPSNHAANSAALAATLGSPVLAAVAVLVGVGRVVDGQHWPIDVFAGWGIGGVIGLGFRRLAEWCVN